MHELYNQFHTNDADVIQLLSRVVGVNRIYDSTVGDSRRQLSRVASAIRVHTYDGVATQFNG